MARPPPSLVRSGWPGTAWQEEHPPALNVVSPFARFGAWAGAVTADITGTAVSHQKTPKAVAPARTALRKIRRNIHRSVTVHLNLTASMACVPAMDRLKNSGRLRHFSGIKPESCCFETGTI